MPLTGTSRKDGLMRHSMNFGVWLGPPDCHRNQDNVLWTPSDTIFADGKSEKELHNKLAGRACRDGRIAETEEERGGTTPFNLLPVPVGGIAATYNCHPATTTYDNAAWWVKYLLPQGSVLLDCFAG